MQIEKHLISAEASVRATLEQLNKLGKNMVLFVTDGERKVQGAVTDGDIRRSLLDGTSLDAPVSGVMNANPYVFEVGKIQHDKVRSLKKLNIKLAPIVDTDHRVIDILELDRHQLTLPLDAVLMAGGRGARLKPLTDKTPKPLLPVGGKPIIEHALDHLARNGIEKVHISINYKKEMIRQHLENGKHSNNVSFVEEEHPLGTAGALTLLEGTTGEALLLMNSDLLTDLDIEAMYDLFESSQADMVVATTEYKIEIPYAVIDLEEDTVRGIQEKPTHSLVSNAGIYLINKSLISKIPKNTFYDATDLLEDVINSGGIVKAFPITGYWMDIGKLEDLNKARSNVPFPDEKVN